MKKSKSFMRLVVISLVVAIMEMMAISCKKTNAAIEIYKDFNRTKNFVGEMPVRYKYTDYALLAEAYDKIVFDFEAKGIYLPLIWEDETFNSFGIPAYVGDDRMNKDGAQEAVTAVAAVLSASLLGIDKSNQDEMDYVNMLNVYFNEAEGIILNNPRGSSAFISMWYLLYPAILYTQVADLYTNQPVMAKNVLINIESWYGAYEVMYRKGQPDFDYTGFNFLTHTPYRNGIWKEPDCAVGIAVLMYYGYELTDDEKYLTATINLMNYIESFFGGPLYEVLMYYAPVLSARLNTFHGTDYDLNKSLNRIFDGSSIPRGGWGSLVGKWGEYDVDGLFGSTTDGGGYAFSMNTFVAAGTIVPIVQYDSRYAKSIGKWLLRLSNNARYFFSRETDKANQSVSYAEGGGEELKEISEAVPFEGIRKDSNGKTPWIGGDPTVYGWAKTDFSLYSGAHTGILGALIGRTNQEGILKIDLLATRLNKAESYPTYLIYNPHKVTKKIKYSIGAMGDAPIDLYDTVTNTVIAKAIIRDTELSISSDTAVVIVEIPANIKIIQKGLNKYANGIYVATNQSTVLIRNFKNNDTVSGKINFEIFLASNCNDLIKESTVSIDGQVLFLTDNKILIDTKNFETGAKKLVVKILTENGMRDETSIRLNFHP